MHEDVHNVHVYLKEPVILGFVRKQDILDTKQRDKDEGPPHRPHVEAGLSLMCHPQLGDEDSNNIQQEEEVHLELMEDCQIDLLSLKYDFRVNVLKVPYHQCSTNWSMNNVE